MYGKWLYKEIGTEYGACMVEIYRKNYTGGSIEIGALAADSLSIALENLGSITDPIGKSVCSFSIIDTNQVEYDDFFTPDATALKVVVSTRVGGGAYVTRWSGYVTPDFFAENLSYRTPISISARDNIGYLNDVDFDLTATTITVRELIQSAFNRIAEDYPMSLSFVTQKQTAEGILAIDATISTTLLREMSWGEALETILHDLGLQMRWVDNNTIAVLDLSQIPEYYATQVFNFVDASGYREIVPAWRELSQEQNYGVRENFFEGWLREDNITFVKTENIRIPLSMGGVTGLVPMRYYTPNNWGVAGNTFVINPKDYVYFGTYGQMAQPFGERIFFTGVEKDATNIANNYMSYRQDVYASNRPMRITFKAFTSVMATGGIGNNDALLAYDPANRFMDFATGDTLQLGLKVNLLLHVGTRTYILGQNWEEINGAETNSLYFVLPKIGQVDGSSVTPNEEEITIDVNTIPNDGVLELRIYGFTIHNKTNLQEDAGSAIYDWLRMVSYINEVKYTYNIDNPDTGRYSQVEVNKQHNIKDTQSYTFGQIPVEGGAVNAFAGGLFKADGNELIGFQRNADATNYNLLELVGRELIHFNKKNYNRLSGTIKNLNKEPLMFNRLFVREGKKYAPYNYSLNVISNEMNITSMQEVEPYETSTFNTIDSQITTGGGTVSGGNNTILQYSEEAGNEKRLFELQTATEQEKSDAYVLVDKAGFPEARKVHVSELGGIDVRALEQYLEKNGYTALKTYWTFNEQDDTLRTTHNIVVEGGGAFGMGAESGDVPCASVSIKFEDSNIVYSPVDGIITLPAYPSGGGGVADSVDWANVYNKPTTLGGYGITDALSISGGTITGSLTIKNDSWTPIIFERGGYTSWIGTTGVVIDVGHSDGYLSVGKDTLQFVDYNTVRNILHSANYANYALPLSGGTFNFPQLSIGTTVNPRIGKFDREAGSLVFQLGTSNIFDIIDSGWKNVMLRVAPDEFSYYGNSIIHSGNIGSQSVNYASSAGNANTIGGKYEFEFYHRDRGAISGDQDIATLDTGCYWVYESLGATNPVPSTYSSLVAFGKSYYSPQMSVLHNADRAWLRGVYNTSEGYSASAWHELAFLDSNVASATKLQTARTIWGQSFDGTGSVDGEIQLHRDCSIQSYNSLPLVINKAGNNIQLVPNGYGNVLVGTTYDGGHRLLVAADNDWTARLTSTKSSVWFAHSGGYGMILESTNNSAGTYLMNIMYGVSSLGYSDGITAFRVNDNGNVLIDTTNDNGAKLQVQGDGTISDGLTIGYRFSSPGTSNAIGAWLKLATPAHTGSNAWVIAVDDTSGASSFLRIGYDINSLSFSFEHNGNFVATGGGAFGSDIRYKDITSYRQIDLETIVNAPLFTFKWTDREDKVEHLGTSAQYWLDTQFKDAVNITNPKFFHLDYGALAVGIGISVAREVKGVKTEVELLREKVNQLEQELAQYRRS